MRRIKYLIDSGSSTTLLKKYIVYFFYLHLKKKKEKNLSTTIEIFITKKNLHAIFSLKIHLIG